MTQQGSEHEPPVGGAAADPGRSGGDVAEAIRTADAGTARAEVEVPPRDPSGAVPSGAAAPRSPAAPPPVEQVAGDPAMTRGQRVGAPGAAATTTGPEPAASGGAGAQSVLGARATDRVAAGEPPAGAAAAAAAAGDDA